MVTDKSLRVKQAYQSHQHNCGNTETCRMIFQDESTHRAIPDGPVMDDRNTSVGPPIDKPEVPNEVLLPEAVPSGLHKHGVEAWVEFPHRALVHHQDRCEVLQVWDDGGLAAAHPSAGSTVGCAVDALAVGVAASHI
uniref:Uncharacterized protein n=1 Tax=Oryza nivara TaxID=4536 RepID=A0A0E0JCF8_ORYNI